MFKRTSKHIMKLLNILFGCTFVLFNIEQISHGNRYLHPRQPWCLGRCSTETKYQTKHQSPWKNTVVCSSWHKDMCVVCCWYCLPGRSVGPAVVGSWQVKPKPSNISLLLSQRVAASGRPRRLLLLLLLLLLLIRGPQPGWPTAPYSSITESHCGLQVTAEYYIFCQSKVLRNIYLWRSPWDCTILNC